MQRVLFFLMLLVGMATMACTDSTTTADNTSPTDNAVSTSTDTKAATTASASTTASSTSSEWGNWRGPNHNGAVEATNLPAKFSPTENVKWKADLGGTGASTPVIGGDYIFTTAANLEKKQLLAICINRKTGKTVWSKSVGSGYKPGGDGDEVRLGSRSNYASPSPVTDGKMVVFFFGNGDLVGMNADDGKELWRHNIQKEEGDFTFQWTFSATPTLFKNKLYLAVLQRDEVTHGRGKAGNLSYVLCYDAASGKKLFKHVRPSKAKKESLESFATIIPHNIDGKDQLVIVGGDVITGHEPATGKELWRWGTWNKNHREQWWRLVPTPCPGPDNIFLVCAPKKAPVYAVQVKDGKADLLWKSEDKGDVTSDVPTPLYYMNKFYVLSDVRRSLSQVDPKTGKVLWSVKTPGMSKYRSSPLGADGKLYLMNHAGEVIVFNAADGKLLSQNKMAGDDDTYARASIICVDNQLFVRTETKIFCIAK